MSNAIDVVQSEVITYLTRKSGKRPYKLVDKAGNVVGEAGRLELSVQILTKAGFLFEKEDGRKQTVCAGWEGPCPARARPSANSFRPWTIRQRHGDKWRCRSCTRRRSLAATTPEQRSERARKGCAAMTPEQRSERARKGKAAMTTEHIIEAARKASAAITPEQRSEIARKRDAAMTPEQRIERARKAAAASAARTPEQRRESVRKGHAVRAAKRDKNQ